MKYVFSVDLDVLYDRLDNDLAVLNIKSKGILKEKIDYHVNNMFTRDDLSLENDLLSLPYFNEDDKKKISELFLNEYLDIENPGAGYLTIEESATRDYNNKIPIYFIFNGADNMLSSLIKFFSRGDYSHASISTEGVNEVTSFANTYRNNGFVTETFSEFLDWRKPKVISVLAVQVDPEVYRRIRQAIKKFRDTLYNYKFSTKKLILFHFHNIKFDKTKEPKSMLCVEYVNYVLSIANANLNMKYWITPSDMNKTIQNMKDQAVDVIFEGPIEEFRIRAIDEYRALYDDKVWALKKKIDDEIDNAEGAVKGFIKEYYDIKNLIT